MSLRGLQGLLCFFRMWLQLQHAGCRVPKNFDEAQQGFLSKRFRVWEPCLPVKVNLRGTGCLISASDALSRLSKVVCTLRFVEGLGGFVSFHRPTVWGSGLGLRCWVLGLGFGGFWAQRFGLWHRDRNRGGCTRRFLPASFTYKLNDE